MAHPASAVLCCLHVLTISCVLYFLTYVPVISWGMLLPFNMRSTLVIPVAMHSDVTTNSQLANPEQLIQGKTGS